MSGARTHGATHTHTITSLLFVHNGVELLASKTACMILWMLAVDAWRRIAEVSACVMVESKLLLIWKLVRLPYRSLRMHHMLDARRLKVDEQERVLRGVFEHDRRSIRFHKMKVWKVLFAEVLVWQRALQGATVQRSMSL